MRFILCRTVNSFTALKQSGEVLQILSSLQLTFTRLGLHLQDKTWIYNKYQEGAAFWYFSAEGKVLGPSAAMSGPKKILYLIKNKFAHLILSPLL